MSITRSLTRPLTRKLTRPLTSPGVGGGFRPSSLFRNGEKGLALDLTDMSTLYQDRERTTLVTATGQPIGSPSDISGNNAHPLAAANDTTRPTFDGYATFDGSNDYWVSPFIDLSGSDEVTVVVGLYKESDENPGLVLEHSPTISSNDGAFALTCPQTAGVANVRWNSKGTANAFITKTADPAPTFMLLTAKGDISAPLASISINGGAASETNNTQGTGNYGNHQLYIGRRGGTTIPFYGRIYRMIVIGRLLDAAELESAEAWASAPFT